MNQDRPPAPRSAGMPAPPVLTETLDGGVPPQPDDPSVLRAEEERPLWRRLLDLLLHLLPF